MHRMLCWVYVASSARQCDPTRYSTRHHQLIWIQPEVCYDPNEWERGRGQTWRTAEATAGGYCQKKFRKWKAKVHATLRYSISFFFFFFLTIHLHFNEFSLIFVLGLIDIFVTRQLSLTLLHHHHHQYHTIIKIKYKKVIGVTMLQTFPSSKYKKS